MAHIKGRDEKRGEESSSPTFKQLDSMQRKKEFCTGVVVVEGGSAVVMCRTFIAVNELGFKSRSAPYLCFRLVWLNGASSRTARSVFRFLSGTKKMCNLF